MPLNATQKTKNQETRVGAFLIGGLLLIMAAIIALGGNTSFFTRQNSYQVHFTSVDGLITGAKVLLSGIQVGIVEDIEIDPEKKDVSVKLSVARRYADWIREDSTAEIASLGVLGDKMLRISQGDPKVPVLPANSKIPPKATQDLNLFLSRGDQLLVSLNSIASSLDRLLKTFEESGRSTAIFDGIAGTAKNLSSATAKLNKELDEVHLGKAMKALNSILEKIDRGKGTVGALINDPALYDDAKALVGGANRNRILRNLVRETIKKNDTPSAEPASNR